MKRSLANLLVQVAVIELTLRQRSLTISRNFTQTSKKISVSVGARHFNKATKK